MKRKLILGICCMASQMSHAGVNPMNAANVINFARNEVKPVVMVSGGAAFRGQKGNSPTFVIDPASFSFSADNATQTHGVVGLFVGGLFPINPQWSMQAGLAYYYFTRASQTGNLVQGVDPGSADHFKYEYDLISQQLLLETKLMTSWCHYYPYLNAAIGAAFNRASNYQTSNVFTQTFTPQFKSRGQNSFSYNIGFGVDADIKQNWRFGVGYRYTNFGNVSLGAGHVNRVAISGSLNQSNMDAHEVLAQLTYIIC